MREPIVTKKPASQMWVVGGGAPDWLLATAVLAGRVEREEPASAFVALCDAYLKSHYPDALAQIAEAATPRYKADPHLLANLTPPPEVEALTKQGDVFESAAESFLLRWLGPSDAAGRALGRAVGWIADEARSKRVAEAIEGCPVLMALMMGNTDAKPGKVAQRHLVTYIREGFKALGADRRQVSSLVVDGEQYVAIECDFWGDVEGAAKCWTVASSNLFALRRRFDSALGVMRDPATQGERAVARIRIETGYR